MPPIPVLLKTGRPANRPVIEPNNRLVDKFGRVADDLRISVTDRCNLRCVYCMPASDMRWLDRTDLLSFEEIERLVRMFVGLGVGTVHITGGEPLLRPNLADLVAAIADIRPRPEIAMTTNGVLLARHAADLAAAGLDRVNVSLDSLDSERNSKITRRDDLQRTIDGLDAAKAAGLEPVKVNCVIIRGTNSDEIEAFVEFGRSRGYTVRFIEYMPLDAGGAWSKADVFTAEEMLDSIAAAGHEPSPDVRDPTASAQSFLLDDSHDIGIIPSVTAPFCGTCNRLRITADGGFRTCLFALDETPLRPMLRGGASNATIADAVSAAVWQKWAGHKIGRHDFVRPDKSMSQIGG